MHNKNLKLSPLALAAMMLAAGAAAAAEDNADKVQTVVVSASADARLKACRKTSPAARSRAAAARACWATSTSWTRLSTP
jgi:hypothetical protein